MRPTRIQLLPGHAVSLALTRLHDARLTFWFLLVTFLLAHPTSEAPSLGPFAKVAFSPFGVVLKDGSLAVLSLAQNPVRDHRPNLGIGVALIVVAVVRLTRRFSQCLTNLLFRLTLGQCG